MSAPTVHYFSDVLCVWAWLGEVRHEKVLEAYGGRAQITGHFCSVFTDTVHKIEKVWGHRGGYEGFNRHLVETAGRFDHVTLNEDVWRTVKPKTSSGPHLFLRAVARVADAATFEIATRRVRNAFFAEARDISSWGVLAEIAEELGIDYAAVQAQLQDSSAIADLAYDEQLASKLGVKGSPTWVMNEGRQVLFGNVGYRTVAANLDEILHEPTPGEASWC